MHFGKKCIFNVCDPKLAKNLEMMGTLYLAQQYVLNQPTGAYYSLVTNRVTRASFQNGRTETQQRPLCIYGEGN